MTADEIRKLLDGAAKWPWEVSGDYIVSGGDTICELLALHEAKANARLIVAAPALARRVLELEGMIAEEQEDADRLERALAVSIEDGMWNAFSLGHVRNDRWHHRSMSDAEELVFALGMNLEDKSWDAAAMKAAIPEAAKEKAAAIRARGE